MPPDFQCLDDARAWHRAWLRDAALPLWSAVGVDASRGSFHEALTLDGRPTGDRRRARVQARQVWAFATSGYAEVARRGFAFFLDHYRRPDGLFAFAADHDGVIVDPTPALYEQAFSLLAMSALGETQAARATRGALEALRHPAGGFREAGEHPFQANAHMHLLEAALAWEEAGDASWAPLSDEIAGLALERFVDSQTGALREFFDAQWRALPESGGGLIEPGHQFEWAWLLRRWGERRGHGAAQAAARRLYAHGLRGVDAGRQVAAGAIWSDGRVREPTARLWAQTEFLRAALTFGTEAEALTAARGLATFLDAPTPGTWRDKLKADGSFVDEPSPATSLYHLVAGLRPFLAG
jgi:mannose-1-phosphate guanylyltransferase / mannose-6-phosphate isomerase